MRRRFEVLSSKPQSRRDKGIEVGGTVAYRMGHFESVTAARAFCDALRLVFEHKEARLWIVVASRCMANGRDYLVGVTWALESQKD